MKLQKFGLIILCFFAQLGWVSAQIPTVPSQVRIVDMDLKITSGARAKIQKDINAIRSNDKYFRVKLDLVNLYFPIIEQILREENVPEDIKYLSIQESALQSDAVSSSNAVGYWQFKDFTAREVGLRVDRKIDERKNIVAATRGAAEYFKRNYAFFSNWIYAVNAYMTGPGGAKRYVDKRNFGKSEMTITENTHWYVLRFIAHVLAYREEIGAPHSQGLKLATYTKGANKDLDQIARQLNVDRDQLGSYNKWLAHGKIPTDKKYSVILPVQGEIPNQALLASTIKEPESNETTNTYSGRIRARKAIEIKMNGLDAVMAGHSDNINSLTFKTGISERKFRKFNDLKETQKIQSGKTYYTERKKNRSAIRYHVAQYGESLWGISQKYGIKLKKLAKKNRMEMTDQVKPGRLMWLRKKRPKNTPVEYHEIPKPKPVIDEKRLIVKQEEKKVEEKNAPKPSAKQPAETRNTSPLNSSSAPIVYQYHLVGKGETLWAIAERYKVSIGEIQEWNDLTSSSISPGQRLRLREDKITEPRPVPPPVASEKPNGSNANRSQTHTVAKGESLWSIAQQYNVAVDDLKSWNNFDSNTLSVGQQIVVKGGTARIAPEKPKPLRTEKTHQIEAGESLWAISQKYGVTVAELQKWNDLDANESLRIGQTLIIKESSQTKPKAEEPKKTPYEVYIVRGGDSLYKIARKYNTTVEELMSINNLTSSSLSVGDELKVKRH